MHCQVIDPARLFTVSSPSNINMGSFARLAQATSLLGRVFRHIGDLTADKKFHHEEAAQLDRTIRALNNLAKAEGQLRDMVICPQTAICYRYAIAYLPRFLFDYFLRKLGLI